jgi:hypothetical protein
MEIVGRNRVTLRRLDKTAQKLFWENKDDKDYKEEVYPGVQLGRGKINGRMQDCVVIGELVAVFFDDKLPDELEKFFKSTWRGEGRTITERYQSWLKSLTKTREITRETTDRIQFFRRIGAPPPPGPAGAAPAPAPPPGSPPQVYGHLPFGVVTAPNDVFYRFEAWPTSRRIHQNTNLIAPGTYASPMSELPSLATGFSAVARNALPSLFPACFRWEIQPTPATPIDCGAIVPMYGQSGGGVEVMFKAGAQNRGPIANPVVVPPY